MRRVVDVRIDPDAELSDVVAHVERDGVLAYPTETVYGLGGRCSPEVIDRVRALKQRGGEKPFLVLVPSVETVPELEWTRSARELVSMFWPGPLTVVLRDPSRRFPEGVRDPGHDTVALRVTSHPVTSKLVRTLGAPLISTSLNDSGAPPATSGVDAARVLDGWDAEDVWLVEAGALRPSGPSTVVDCTHDEPVVVREGTLSIGRLRCVIPETHGS